MGEIESSEPKHHSKYKITTVIRLKKERYMLICITEVWEGIYQEVRAELGSEAFVFIFFLFFLKLEVSVFSEFIPISKAKKYYISLLKSQ